MGNSYGAGKIPNLFSNCVLWWDGENETVDGFPIIPSEVTPTPAGTWSNPLDLGTNKIIKTFDGSTNYIMLSDNAAWNIQPDDFTLMGWFRFDAINKNQTLMGQHTEAGGADNYMFLGWYPTSNIIYFEGKAGGTVNWNYTAPLTASATTWYHIVVIKSGTSCLMCVNGSAISVTVGQAWRNTTDLSGYWIIGRSTATYLKGNIKDLLIYKGRALSLPEIKLIMNRTHPIAGTGMIPGPFDYWRLS